MLQRRTRSEAVVMTLNPHGSGERRISTPPDSVRLYVDAHRAELERLLSSAGSSGITLARRHAEITDGLLLKLYAAAHFERHDSSLLFGAVGGYGRQLLGWKSDLDVCFVTTG